MGYGIQTATNEQTTLFTEEHTTQRKRSSIPIYRISLVRESRLHCYHKQIRSSADASALLHTYLADVDREHFVVLMLDQKNKVIGIHTVSIGSLTASIVHPREVFKPAILSNAANILLAHNHPSGAPRSA
jgi:DNA repair protein RadC